MKGTPTDCVIMGVRQIMADKRPDLVLSGVNRGQNVAEDVTYSGTIAGAMEGTLLGIPSIALSQAYGGVGAGTAIDGKRRKRSRGARSQHLGGRHPAGRSHQRQFPALRGGRGPRASRLHRKDGATPN